MYSYQYPALFILITTSFLNQSYAAGLDRSGQPITDFFQDGTYASISYNYSIPHISGVDTGLSSQGIPQEIPNLSEKNSSLRGAVKFDLNEKVSLGLIYDQPFSINLKHHGQQDFVSQTETLAQGTQAQLDNHNLTGLVGLNINTHWGVFAGPALQEVKGTVQLRGQIYRSLANYDAELFSDYAMGWVSGVVFKKPEIALKAALTYRSEIKHKAQGTEQFSALSDEVYLSDLNFTTPESVNVDFQTGLSQKTLLNANLRWIPWKDFEFKPPKLAARTAPATPDNTGYPLISYKQNQWSAQAGLKHKLTDKLAVSGSINWDSGLGNPANALGPIDGYWGAGLGVQYNFTPNWTASLGAKYLWLGDAQAARQNGDIVANFSDNHSVSVGLKLAYQRKSLD